MTLAENNSKHNVPPADYRNAATSEQALAS